MFTSPVFLQSRFFYTTKYLPIPKGVGFFVFGVMF